MNNNIINNIMAKTICLGKKAHRASDLSPTWSRALYCRRHPWHAGPLIWLLRAAPLDNRPKPLRHTQTETIVNFEPGVRSLRGHRKSIRRFVYILMSVHLRVNQ